MAGLRFEPENGLWKGSPMDIFPPPMEVEVYVCNEFDFDHPKWKAIGCGWADYASNYPDGLKHCPMCGEILNLETHYM